MHQSYEERLKHKADFRVKYNFYSKEEGGKERLTYQGNRSDFWYEQGTYKQEKNIFMIWPEFENENGEIILDESIPISKEGTARMWIVAEKGRLFHQKNVKIGLKGFFKEGSKSTAECEIIEILDLHNNPIK